MGNQRAQFTSVFRQQKADRGKGGVVPEPADPIPQWLSDAFEIAVFRLDDWDPAHPELQFKVGERPLTTSKICADVEKYNAYLSIFGSKGHRVKLVGPGGHPSHLTLPPRCSRNRRARPASETLYNLGRELLQQKRRAFPGADLDHEQIGPRCSRISACRIARRSSKPASRLGALIFLALTRSISRALSAEHQRHFR